MCLRARGEMDITTVFGTVIVGSNPAERTRFGLSFVLKIAGVDPTNNTFRTRRFVWYNLPHCGYGLVVEYVLAKDGTRVRFSLPAPLLFFLVTGYFRLYYLFVYLVLSVFIPCFDLTHVIRSAYVSLFYHQLHHHHHHITSLSPDFCPHHFRHFSVLKAKKSFI